ncbi:MAG: hypothetical protein ACK2T2_11415 [Anaerolineales bacterium]
MNEFLNDPMRVMLAAFSLFGTLRSIIAILEAFQEEVSPWRAALAYLLLLVFIFVGSYLILLRWPVTKASEKAIQVSPEWQDALQRKLLGGLILAVSLSLMLGSWLSPLLQIESRPLQATVTPTATGTPATQVSNTPSPSPPPSSTLTPTHVPTSIHSPVPTPFPDGVRMEVIVARVHIRQSPTSLSPSRGELNNGDWVYFDARTFDPQGTLWLRIGRDQDEARFRPWAGMWIFAGAVNAIGEGDLPLLPATATPSG